MIPMNCRRSLESMEKIVGSEGLGRIDKYCGVKNHILAMVRLAKGQKK
jgi:hypothetical protein